MLRKLNKIVSPYFRLYTNKFAVDTLIYFVTDRCNFRCKTCFNAEHMDNASHSDLSIDEIKNISNSLGRLNSLFISGGEPALRNDLADICEIFYLQNKIRSIHLPTNGFYTDKVYSETKKILERCPGLSLTLSLPLDGLKKTHDLIKGVEGSFDKVEQTVMRLSTLKKDYANLTIYIITVVNKLNLNEIIDLSEYIKNNLPVDDHGPSPMRGTPYDKNLSSLSHEEWSDLSGKLLEYQAYWSNKKLQNKMERFISMNRFKYMYDLYTTVLRDKKLPFTCQAGGIIGVLDSSGDVRLCEMTEHVGNVRNVNYDFKKVWFSEKADKVRKEITNCSCTHACFLGASMSMNPYSLLKSTFLGRI
ncbi:MAG: radical SAM protein [Candidatus Scalindua sp.]|jgi:Fe-coproporphyrin III synthase|nr:radical SAM protein [Candidatus Scalindua sp.]